MTDHIPRIIEYRYERVGPFHSVEPPRSDDQLPDMPTHETQTFEIERAKAERLLDEINSAIEKRQKYWTIDEVVLGVEVFVPVDVYCRYVYDEDIESWYGISVTVVPGDLIEPVIPNRVRRDEFIQGRDND